MSDARYTEMMRKARHLRLFAYAMFIVAFLSFALSVAVILYSWFA